MLYIFIVVVEPFASLYVCKYSINCIFVQTLIFRFFFIKYSAKYCTFLIIFDSNIQT